MRYGKTYLEAKGVRSNTNPTSLTSEQKQQLHALQSFSQQIAEMTPKVMPWDIYKTDVIRGRIAVEEFLSKELNITDTITQDAIIIQSLSHFKPVDRDYVLAQGLRFVGKDILIESTKYNHNDWAHVEDYLSELNAHQDLIDGDINSLGKITKTNIYTREPYAYKKANEDRRKFLHSQDLTEKSQDWLSQVLQDYEGRTVGSLYEGMVSGKLGALGIHTRDDLISRLGSILISDTNVHLEQYVLTALSMPNSSDKIPEAIEVVWSIYSELAVCACINGFVGFVGEWLADRPLSMLEYLLDPNPNHIVAYMHIQAVSTYFGIDFAYSADRFCECEIAYSAMYAQLKGYI